LGDDEVGAAKGAGDGHSTRQGSGVDRIARSLRIALVMVVEKHASSSLAANFASFLNEGFFSC